MNKLSLKTAAPYLVAILVFILITLAYFNPLLKGKQIQQSDILQFKGMSKEIVDFREKYGEEPLWTNSMFGGMPAYQISVLYKGNLLKYVNKILMLGLPHPSGYVFLYMSGFFILLLVLRVNPWLAAAGAIAFGFSSYFFIIIEAGHNSKAHAIGFMAPIIAGVILTYRGKYLLGGALTALFVSLELYANHLQITYYLLMMLFILAIAELVQSVRQKQLKTYAVATGVLIAAALLAAGPNITSLLLTYDYGKYTTRGKTELTINPDGSSNKNTRTSGLDKDYATQWSYGKAETMTLFIPNFKGGASAPLGNNTNKDIFKNISPDLLPSVAQMSQYWGDQSFTSGPVYIGAIVMFFAMLGLFLIKGPLKWFLLVATLLSVTLSWGRHFMGLTSFFMDYIPGYNKFRAVSMTLVIAELTLPLLAVLAIDKILKNRNLLKEKISIPLFKNPVSGMKIFIASFILTGGIALLCYLAPGMFSDFESKDEIQSLVYRYKSSNPSLDEKEIYSYLDRIYPSVKQARKAVFKSDAIRSFILITLAATVVYYYSRSKLEPGILAGALLVFILADMWNINKRYLNEDDFVPKRQAEVPYQPSEADQQILADSDPNFRVYNTAARLDTDGATSYFHKSIGGYHGAKLKRYDELMFFHLFRGNEAVYNMLNTKYIIQTGQDEKPVAMRNPGALGHAWFVDEIRWVQNADSEITALNHFDPSRTAIIHQEFRDQAGDYKFSKDSIAEIKLTSYKPNHLVYESNAPSAQLAVFPEIYYPKGWNTYINGQPAPHFRANYVLRAMKIPAGKHTLEFKFEPSLYFTGEKISYAASILLFLLVAGALFMEFKKRRQAA